MVHETLQDKAYQTIRDRLISGIDPQGAQISDHDLSKDLGISRAPIREAMNRLVSEGLLTQRVGKGFFIHVPTRKNIEDLYQYREWIEQAALAEAIHRLTPEDLAQIEKSCEKMHQLADELKQSDGVLLKGEPFKRLNAADARFHLTILQASGNELAAKTIRQQRILEQLWSFYMMPHTAEVLYKIYEEHKNILVGLQEKDLEKSRDALHIHFSVAKKNSLEMYDLQNKEQSDSDFSFV